MKEKTAGTKPSFISHEKAGQKTYSRRPAIQTVGSPEGGEIGQPGA